MNDEVVTGPDHDRARDRPKRFLAWKRELDELVGAPLVVDLADGVGGAAERSCRGGAGAGTRQRGESQAEREKAESHGQMVRPLPREDKRQRRPTRRRQTPEAASPQTVAFLEAEKLKFTVRAERMLSIQEKINAELISRLMSPAGE